MEQVGKFIGKLANELGGSEKTKEQGLNEPSTVGQVNVPLENISLEDNVAYADSLVKEYLLFRGFTQTLKAFNHDKKQDKVKGYHAGKILELLFSYVQSFNMQQLFELWSYLNEQFFLRTDIPDVGETIVKLENSLKRYYVVHCVLKNNTEKLKEFFDFFGESLSTQPEWAPWFALPYMKAPQNSTHFKEYFTKTWFETFYLSIHNFLNKILQSLPPPKMLAFNEERVKRKLLLEQIQKLQLKIQLLENNALNLTVSSTSTPNSNNGVYHYTPLPSPHRSPSPVHFNQDPSSLPTTRLRSSSDADSSLAPNIIPDYASTNSINSRNAEEMTEIKDESANLVTKITDLNVNADDVFAVLEKEVYSGHSSPISRCKFSPDSRTLATASVDGNVRIWSVNSSERKTSSLPCLAEVISLAWESKTNKLLFCGTVDARIKVWNSITDKLVADLKTDKLLPRIHDISCSPNGYNFVTAASSPSRNASSSLLWNMKNFQVENVLPVDPDTACINCVSYNHNGSMIVTGGSDGMIRIYDTSFCSAIMGWNGHNGEILGCQFSDDETAILSVGTDGKGYNKKADIAVIDSAQEQYLCVGSKSNAGILYEIDNAAPVQRLRGHSAPVVAVDWTANLDYATHNNTLSYCATGSLDHTVALYRLKHRGRIK